MHKIRFTPVPFPIPWGQLLGVRMFFAFPNRESRFKFIRYGVEKRDLLAV